MPEIMQEDRMDAINELIGAVYRALDAGLSEGDVMDAVNSAFQSYVPDDGTEEQS